MKIKLLSATALSTMLFTGAAFAADLTSIVKSNPSGNATTIVPKSGLSLGLGGNLNLATFGQQNFYWAGTSNDYFDSGAQYGNGYAAWNTKVNLGPQFRVAPIGQINYFNHFGDTEWMWGSKLAYTYLNSRSSVSNVLIPQFGGYHLYKDTNRLDVSINNTFFGTGELNSFQTSINHQLTLTPYLGRSFSNGYIYAGAGPSLSQVQTNLNNLTGYRNTSGTPTNQTGFGMNYQESHWVWGGAATGGITYFLTPSWYMDLNYTFSQTRSTTSYVNAWYAAPVAGLDGRLASHAIGYAPGSTSAAINTQSVNASLNWVLTSEPSSQRMSSQSVASDVDSVSAASVWSGIYAGVNTGAGWGTNNQTGNNWFLDVTNGGYSNSLTATGAGGGLIGGAQVGYNHTLTPLFVVGVETDLQGTSMGSAGGANIGPMLNLINGGSRYVPGALSGGTSVPFFGTLRARAGITPVPALMLYGTAGFAYADVQNANGAGLEPGWSAGAGAEWMFMPKWSAKAEYLYTDISGSNNAPGTLGVNLTNNTTHIPFNMMRAGLNYHFIADELQPLAPTPFAPVDAVTKSVSAHASTSHWTGFYAGLNAGYGFGLNNNAYALLGAPQGFSTIFNGIAGSMPLTGVAQSQSGTVSNNQNGYIGGFQTGYNYQWGEKIVAGLEADIQGTNISGSGSRGGAGYNINTPNNGTGTSIGGVQISSGVDWLGTVRGRLGYLWNPSLLIFGTAGLTYGRAHASVSNLGYTAYLDTRYPDFNQSSQLFYGDSSHSQTLTGWNAGGGVEWMTSQNWSIKAEALYWNLGNMNVATNSVAPGIGVPLWGLGSSSPLLIPGQAALGNASLNYQGILARAGVNYHFNADDRQMIANTNSLLPNIKSVSATAHMPMWSGFYAGLNAGYDFGTNDSTYVNAWGPQGFTTNFGSSFGTMPLSGVTLAQSGVASNNQSGFLGGAQGGYNYQIGDKYIIGAEADIQGADIRGGGNFVGAGYNVNNINNGSATSIGGVKLSSSVDWLGTARGRVGYLWTPNLMMYATSGLSFGGVHTNVTNLAYSSYYDPTFMVPGTPPGVQPYFGSTAQKQTRIGWNAGAGTEWMVSDNWSVKAEALYWNLGNMNVATTTVAPQIGSAYWGVGTSPRFTLPGQVIVGGASINYQGIITRAGVNYHFNSESTPVIAKY
jgi:opacity protein-like surface antigen